MNPNPVLPKPGRGVRGLACAAAAFLASAAGAASLTITPAAPSYGRPVSIELSETQWPLYLPASRFSRSGNNITLDYEYTGNGFDFGNPSFGDRPLRIGELVPGIYSVTARLKDLTHPEAAPQTVASAFVVASPEPWGAYVIPVAPQAWQATSVFIHSAAYLDPATVVAMRNGNVIRVDFDYAPDAPVGGPAPEGWTANGAVEVDGMPPGRYLVEAYGRSRTSGIVEKFFARDFVVATHMAVVEYFQGRLRHYFMAGGGSDVKLLDAGGAGGWQRTGQVYEAWFSQADAPASARPVCRFYAAGPNSHFFTADPAECRLLKDLEQRQRADDTAAGRPFKGWGYERIVFWAIPPTASQCPADTEPVLRYYNGRAAENDSNHRFAIAPQLQHSMALEWVAEGVHLCSLRVGT